MQALFPRVPRNSRPGGATNPFVYISYKNTMHVITTLDLYQISYLQGLYTMWAHKHPPWSRTSETNPLVLDEEDKLATTLGLDAFPSAEFALLLQWAATGATDRLLIDSSLSLEAWIAIADFMCITVLKADLKLLHKASYDIVYQPDWKRKLVRLFIAFVIVDARQIKEAVIGTYLICIFVFSFVIAMHQVAMSTSPKQPSETEAFLYTWFLEHNMTTDETWVKDRWKANDVVVRADVQQVLDMYMALKLSDDPLYESGALSLDDTKDYFDYTVERFKMANAEALKKPGLFSQIYGTLIAIYQLNKDLLRGLLSDECRHTAREQAPKSVIVAMARIFRIALCYISECTSLFMVVLVRLVEFKIV